jgi:twinkle protein
MEHIETGIYDLDEALDGGIALGQVCLLSGRRGDGKSTFMSQMIANAIDQGYGTFIYSAELPDYQFKGWLNTQVAGEENLVGFKNKYGQTKYVPTSEVQAKIDRWYDGKAFIFDNSFTDEHPEKEMDLISIIEQTIKADDVKLVCVDNLMTAMESVRSQNELYLAQGRFVGQLKKLAIRYNIAVILVAHPRKQGKDTDKDFDNDDVAGSADITNKVDIVLNYYRPKKEEQYQRLLSLEKNRLTGILLKGDHAVKMYYNEKSRGITSERSLPRRYGWQKQPIQVEDIDVPF